MTDLGLGPSRFLDLFIKLCFYINKLQRLFWYSSLQPMQADKADMTLGNYRSGPRTCTRISAYTKIALGNFTPSKVSAPTEVEVFSSYDVAVVKIVPIYTCTCISMINNGMISQIDFEIISIKQRAAVPKNVHLPFVIILSDESHFHSWAILACHLEKYQVWEKPKLNKKMHILFILMNFTEMLNIVLFRPYRTALNGISCT